MFSYKIQLKSNLELSKTGSESIIVFQLFGTLSSTNEIILDANDSFTQEGDLTIFTTNTIEDLGDILQIKIRKEKTSGFDLNLEYVQVNDDQFPLHTNLFGTRKTGIRNIIFATKTEISSSLIYLPEIKGVYYLKIHMGWTHFNRNWGFAKISVKLWGETGNTVLPEDEENFKKEEDRGWIVLESAIVSSDSTTNAFVVGNYGKILCCAIKLEQTPAESKLKHLIREEVPEPNTVLMPLAMPIQEHLYIKNIEIVKESFKINFLVDRTLSEKQGNKLYLNPSGPLERVSDLQFEELKKDTSTISIFKWITRNQKELKLLDRFLTEQKIVSASWGKAFLSSETDNETLRNRLINLDINLDEHELKLWENLKPRIEDMLDSRSFALDFVDERLKLHIDDIIFRVQAELDLIVSFFNFGNLDLPDPTAPPPVEEKHNSLLDFLDGMGTIAKVVSKIPVPQVAKAAAGISTVLGFIGVLAKEEPKEDSFHQELFEAEKRGIEIQKAIQDGKNRMILVTADLTINVYQVFQRIELGRRISKIKALRSIGILEEYSQIESILKENEIEGVPESLAPVNANIKSLLRMIYSKFLREKCHIMAKGIHMAQELTDETLNTDDLIRTEINSTDKDYLFISWTYLNNLSDSLWVQQNWQIFMDPIISPTRIPEKIYKRILWLYDNDLISILEVLKEKARIVPVLCEMPAGINGVGFEIKANNCSILEGGRNGARAYMRADKDLELTLLVKIRANSPLGNAIADKLGRKDLLDFERTIKSTEKRLFKFSDVSSMARENFIIGVGIDSRVMYEVKWISSDLPERWACSQNLFSDFPSTEDVPIINRGSLRALDDSMVAFLKE